MVKLMEIEERQSFTTPSTVLASFERLLMIPPDRVPRGE